VSPDACASEALEIATYMAIERLARRVGDEETTTLAASIRGDEENMLERILRETQGSPTAASAKRSARQGRTVPGVAQVEGQVRGPERGARCLWGPGESPGPCRPAGREPTRSPATVRRREGGSVPDFAAAGLHAVSLRVAIPTSGTTP
jgi:hypothetical protein